MILPRYIINISIIFKCHEFVEIFWENNRSCSMYNCSCLCAFFLSGFPPLFTSTQNDLYFGGKFQHGVLFKKMCRLEEKALIEDDDKNE